MGEVSKFGDDKVGEMGGKNWGISCGRTSKSGRNPVGCENC